MVDAWREAAADGHVLAMVCLGVKSMEGIGDTGNAGTDATLPAAATSSPAGDSAGAPAGSAAVTPSSPSPLSPPSSSLSSSLSSPSSSLSEPPHGRTTPILARDPLAAAHFYAKAAAAGNVQAQYNLGTLIFAQAQKAVAEEEAAGSPEPAVAKTGGRATAEGGQACRACRGASGGSARKKKRKNMKQQDQSTFGADDTASVAVGFGALAISDGAGAGSSGGGGSSAEIDATPEGSPVKGEKPSSNWIDDAPNEGVGEGQAGEGPAGEGPAGEGPAGEGFGEEEEEEEEEEEDPEGPGDEPRSDAAALFGRACELWRSAGAQGHAGALFNVGLMHQHGLVPADPTDPAATATTGATEVAAVASLSSSSAGAARREGKGLTAGGAADGVEISGRRADMAQARAYWRQAAALGHAKAAAALKEGQDGKFCLAL